MDWEKIDQSRAQILKKKCGNNWTRQKDERLLSGVANERKISEVEEPL